ncbi:NAD-dependent epimerase/dehydratase family protein [Vagococcus hydrophili]|uniref:NAD-dependent epimerase/dehydratase family protein n=1 Tax=Vagococcus hydrophili TaxID=2714947 RepID=A0A6G8ARW0_9ENTE|nr:NAD-dependent epimerase/dehydratase family protein [Vagococcus hydrophili]QIL47736.1 NAD-dependent epimerase/dehydratase family protein [Vagococcus hydrophili]
MKPTFVVFGGSGFIGQAVCQEVINRNLPVVSISKHGKPREEELWMSSPLITWLSIDIFKDNSWKQYISDKTCCINLIGIFFENRKKGLTYDKMILLANQLISDEAEEKQAPYLFLSAKAGPCGYIEAKKKAEADLFMKKNQTIIIRSGLVTTKKRPFVYTQGVAIKISTHLPIIKRTANKVYPVPLKHLVTTIINESLAPSHKIIEDIR